MYLFQDFFFLIRVFIGKLKDIVKMKKLLIVLKKIKTKKFVLKMHMRYFFMVVNGIIIRILNYKLI